MSVAGYHLGFDAPAFARHVFKNYHDKLFGLHLSDNDGTFDVHHVHGADSWQLKMVDEYYDFLEDKPVGFEWNRKTNDERCIRQGLEFVMNRYKGVHFHV